MDDFPGVPIHVQNALRRAGVGSVDQARALGLDAVSKIPGVGPLALSRLFQSGPPRPQRTLALSADELRRARRWFDALEEAAPLKLNDGDRALAEKIARGLE